MRESKRKKKILCNYKILIIGKQQKNGATLTLSFTYRSKTHFFSKTIKVSQCTRVYNRYEKKDLMVSFNNMFYLFFFLSYFIN